MTRQINRQIARAEAKAELAQGKLDARKVAKRSLLERQTAREKAELYTGRSVGASISPSRSRITKRRVKKGVPFGRIILTQGQFTREFTLHATKGWRSHRA